MTPMRDIDLGMHLRQQVDKTVILPDFPTLEDLASFMLAAVGDVADKPELLIGALAALAADCSPILYTAMGASAGSEEIPWTKRAGTRSAATWDKRISALYGPSWQRHDHQ